jgi:hypothetical protein
MNSIVEKGASKGALFLLALQSSFLCGLYGCALTQENRAKIKTSFLLTILFFALFWQPPKKGLSLL